MMDISGQFYDGRSSAAKKARLVYLPEVAFVRVEDAEGSPMADAPVSALAFAPHMGRVHRSLGFPCGGLFETEDHGAMDALQISLKKGAFWRFVHMLESRWIWVCLALLFVMGTVFLSFRYGAPVLAREIALRLPPGILHAAGENTLKTLDRMVFSPSDLSSDSQEKIKDEFRELWEAHPGFQLYFRKGGQLGANAFALPGNMIVVSDELIRLAEDNPDGLEAVLAHEIGHGVHQHAARRVIQDSMLAFLLMGLTGDGSGVAELFMGLPVLITEMAYSRAFEREADAYAMEWLALQGKDAEGFARLLVRLHEEAGGRVAGKSRWQGWLSTHPHLEERLEAMDFALP
ncbi:peptidase M48-like protein [Desulfobotulus alkaliphilus]|uniref:Peptidase M48-like protein n=1 Tax=Desulfobotulus alkaliphilus TaxID=622671 RepID=A0A562SA56_9BACT|nr:M48 family metallopeptidase [Desulfobotulus alkaliphilus]TWI77416.1 peptidase M48-like protein [Desulfobotulus alkaliphilus]